jgi:UDP-N-acetylmuramyl pentapeptide phosphotransferase/UDP-N-acetylglucosamine-1-phosphate transferase
MFTFLISFVASALFTLLVIKQAKAHGAALDSDLSGVQKVHASAVPRIGGMGIFFAMIFTGIVTMLRLPELAKPTAWLLGCAAIAFYGGIAEDFTRRVGVMQRLLLTMAAAAAGYFMLDAHIDRLDWMGMTWVLPTIWLALPLTVVAVAGVANAVNIIDGFNGLAGAVSLFMLLSLAYVAFQVGDTQVLVAALTVAGATAGFLIWNYPAGMIFLGDGGAYLVGFMLAELTVLLVMRNPTVSTWYAALLLVYPVFETLFSAYRRLFLRGQSPGMPDGIHLHSLIFRRIVCWAIGRDEASAVLRRNALTSPYLWLLSLMAVIPATMFWQYTPVLMGFCLLFVVSYVWLYARIVTFRSPRWMMLGRREPRDAAAQE